MLKAKVVDNTDELKMGRVKIEDGRWLTPIAYKDGLFAVPPVGSEIIVHQEYYLATLFNKQEN